VTDSITPPPELVQQWFEQWEAISLFNDPVSLPNYIASRAAQWGADQELEACCEWTQGYAECGDSLRAARRPKPPSLKEQALEVVTGLEKRCDLQCDLACIRRALEALPND
jgi:hypothetical protein